MKKWLFLTLLVSFTVILSGCTLPFTKPKPENITLKYWGLWEPEQIMRGVINDYQKLHPNITIEYKRMSPQRYRETVTTRLAENVGPDIFRFHNTWLPMLKNDLSPIPPEVMDQATIKKTYYPVVTKDLAIGDKYYGLPLEMDVLALYINSDIFNAAGVTPPGSWEEFKITAQKVTTKSEGKIQTAGAAIGTANNIQHWSDILGLMLLQNGTEMTKVDNTILSDGSNAGVDAIDYYASFAIGENRVWDETLDDSVMAFSQGKVAMIFAPHWQIFEIKVINPNLNFYIAPVPQLSGGKVNWATYWVEGVAKKSKYQKEAFEFLKYLTAKETVQKLYSDASKYRLFGEPYSRIEMAPLIKDDQFAGVFVKEAETATSWYMSSRTYDNGLNDKIIQYFTVAVEGLNKESVTTKNALTTVANGINSLLSQYGLISGGVPQK